MCARGEVPEGVYQRGGGFARGGCAGGCPRGGVCARGGSGPMGVVSQHALRQTSPINRMTDRCKNITLATTSLRPVKM